MTREELLKIGFEEIPTYTINNSIIYHLGRNKYLSIGCVGTPNEMVFLYEKDYDDTRKINDIITLRNYDYDGYTTIDTIKLMIDILKVKDFIN